MSILAQRLGGGGDFAALEVEVRERVEDGVEDGPDVQVVPFLEVGGREGGGGGDVEVVSLEILVLVSSLNRYLN